MADTKTVYYKHPKITEVWEKTVPVKVAEKMVRLGRWKYEKPVEKQAPKK